MKTFQDFIDGKLERQIVDKDKVVCCVNVDVMKWTPQVEELIERISQIHQELFGDEYKVLKFAESEKRTNFKIIEG